MRHISVGYSFLTIYPLPLWDRNKERGIASPLVGEGKGRGGIQNVFETIPQISK